jgi:hypothetical protein
MDRNVVKQFTLLVLVSLMPGALFSQREGVKTDTVRKEAVKVFLDWPGCDMNYIRREIPYINYVRDTREAEVYILVTDQNTGSGGEEITLLFQGQGKYDAMDDTLTYSSSPDLTNTIVREKSTDMLKIGLMRFVAKTPLFNEIEITHNSDLEAEEVVDRWNNWVFEISTEPQFESEETQKELDLRNSLNITRVTPEMKLEIEIDQFYNREKYIENVNTDSASSKKYVTSATFMDNLFVKSLGEHWSAGVKWGLGSSTRENYGFSTEILPSVEYDIYPYSESTHRQLRIMYSAGLRYNNYIDTTVYNKTGESLYLQMLNVAFQIKKKWGSINMGLTGSNYFHDFSKNRVELFTSLNIRIFKGLSLEINGGVAHINDQLNIKKGDVSEAERLLQLRELATKYRLEGGIEITYTFGSIYNNIVNPRFNSGDFHY